MTDQELKDLVASLAVAQAKTDMQMARTDAQMAQSEARLDRLSALYGGVAANQGASAEEFFFNSLTANPVLGGIKFDRITETESVRRGKNQAEFDIVLVNGQSVAVIEVKYKVHPSDIEKTEKNLRRYREFYPEHKDFDLYGGIAGFSVPAEAVKAAKERGLFVLQRKGDLVTTNTKGMRAL